MFTFTVKDVTAKFEVMNVRGVERMSEPYEFELEVLSSDTSLPDYIGREAYYRLEIGSAITFRHGLLNQITVTNVDDSNVRYLVSLVPSITRLELKSDCRIFQDVTIEDVLGSVFEEHGIEAYELNLGNTHSPKSYLVQYRETDLDFLHRIMEEEGLFYYFEHDHSGHTLVITDDAAAYKTLSGGSQSLHYGASAGTAERVKEFSLSQLAATNAVRLRDFNYELPGANLDVSRQVPRTTSLHELYDYPGGYKMRSDGQRQARWRFDAERLHARSADAVTNSSRLAPGFTFKLSGHPYRPANKSYVATEVIHHGEQDSASGRLLRYENNVVCLSEKTPYRLTDRYPSLTMQGPQTATVVGPSGEETHVDELGRVKVQFHWDREGEFDEHSSAWIRVAQSSAGNSWGHFVIPRVGSEVLVDFVNGDPHRPVIIGSLYNGSNHVPYPLPENKNITALKTKSTPSGRGFNELIFDDTAGSERVSLRAQKDLSLLVQNDHHENIASNFNVNISNDATIAIGNDRTESVGSNRSLTIGGSKTEQVSKSYSLDIGDDHTCSVGKKLTQEIADHYTCTVGKNATVNAKSILFEAMDAIAFKVGDARVEMKKSGDIKIEGKKIDIKASGKLTMKGSNIS